MKSSEVAMKVAVRVRPFNRRELVSTKSVCDKNLKIYCVCCV